MNWATIAPESRIYKGTNLYRWDMSPGLEHHCGICATPLHNARAKTSCLFHQQLHFVGKSHECFGCNSSDEMHHNRHKDILKIVRQINTFDQANKTTSISKPTGGGKPRRDSIATSTTTPTDTSSETFAGDGFKLTRRERKKAKKAGNGSIAKEKHNLEVFSREEIDFISEAIHLKIHETKGAWEGTYNYDSKLPEEFLEDQGVVDTDAEDPVEDLEAYSVKSLAARTPRQRRTVKKFNTPVGHSSFKGGSRKFSPITVTNDPYNGVDPQIFFRLGIEMTHPSRHSKARRDLLMKLVAAIKEDLDIIEREEAETAVREEGFWRWAGKTAYNTIKSIREDLDWATGQKKGVPRRDGYLGDNIPEDDMEHLASIVEQQIESFSPILSTDDPTFAPRVFAPNMQIDTWKKCDIIAKVSKFRKAQIENSPVLNLLEDDTDKPWFPATSNSKKVDKAPVADQVEAFNVDDFFEDTLQNVEDLSFPTQENKDDDEGWSVVTRSKGTSKQSKATAPLSVYRKPGESMTISIK